jgi:hypothetical protein
MFAWAPEKDARFSPYRLAAAEGLGRMGLDRGLYDTGDATYDVMVDFFAQLRARLIGRTLDGG